MPAQLFNGALFVAYKLIPNLSVVIFVKKFSIYAKLIEVLVLNVCPGFKVPLSKDKKSYIGCHCKT